MYTSTFLSQLGYIRACASKTGLYAIDWQQHPFTENNQENHVSRETIRQIRHYLSGQLFNFTVPFDLSAHSPDFVKWLSVLAKVPYGSVITYSEFAQRWGNIKAARAAGQTCRRNPLPIVLPCHRIVNTNGKLHNYSGGDRLNPSSSKNIQRKRWLIELEAKRSLSYSSAQRSHCLF